MARLPGAPETDAGAAFEAAWEEAYGDLPPLPYLNEVYDAVYLISLAAEHADSVDATAIRDALREVASAPGTAVGPGTEGWQAAVAALDAGEDINYEGAAGPVDFDENGDVSKGTHPDLAGRGGRDCRREPTTRSDAPRRRRRRSPDPGARFYRAPRLHEPIRHPGGSALTRIVVHESRRSDKPATPGHHDGLTHDGSDP